MCQDENIIELIKNGNIEAFNRLFMDTYHQLYFHCRKFISDPDDAKDLIQNVYLRFWERRLEIDINISVYAYLLKAIQNESLNHIRSKKTINSLSDPEIEKESNFNYGESNFNSPESNLEINELEQITLKAINSLPDKCKIIFMLSRNEGLKNQEIADKLDISVRTVETQIYRALKIIRVWLHDYMALIIGLPFFLK